MHKRKDTLVAGRAGGNDWAKHLRPFGKRSVAKAERIAAKCGITDEMVRSDEPSKRFGLHNSPRTMRRLIAEKGESVIPRGMYCYDGNGICAYWDKAETGKEKGDGYCWFLDKGDWDDGIVVLFDQCKNCGVKDDDAPEGTVSIQDERRVVSGGQAAI